MNFIKKYSPLLLVGGLSGAINGFLGAGGGIVVTFYLSRILNENEKSENGVFANAVATMLPISVVSLLMYILKGYIKMDNELISLFPSALIGGILGAYLLTKLKLKIVKLIFSILITVSGIMMIFK